MKNITQSIRLQYDRKYLRLIFGDWSSKTFSTQLVHGLSFTHQRVFPISKFQSLTLEEYGQNNT